MSDQLFTHLHFHTAYSLLDGACRVDRVMERANELGMTRVAMTDHGVLYGALEFYQQAKQKGIKPILGCEVYVAKGDMHERKSTDGSAGANHLVLLAEDETGWYNLSRLVSLAHLEGFYYKPRVDKALLSRHHKGLIALSSCLKGEVAELCANGDEEAALRTASAYADLFGKDNFFIELQDHGLPGQRIANRGLREIARRLALPLVATNDVHYLKAEHAEAHDVLLCLQTGTVMTDPKRMRYDSDQFYMKSADEMWALFADVPEALTNTSRIADRCNVELQTGSALHFPVYRTPEGVSHRDYLMQLVRDGIRERYGMDDLDHPRNDHERTIADRVRFEVGVIEHTKFVNYFLVVWDFIHFAKSQGIPVGPGRGSGAGSIVAYALGITGLDPLRYGLIFERFLNPERVSPPDFDIDFCQTRRGEVIEYVKNKYGRENCAQIVTFGTLGAKTVIRDIGRALEIPLNECDRLAKMVPEEPNMTLELALAKSPEFKQAASTEEHAQRILKHALVLEGLPRQTGVHAAGVVIGEKPLIEIVPLTRDKNNEVITQFEMVPLEKMGLLKMDFLGLKTLTVIREAVDNIRERRGEGIDIDEIPIDDKATYALLARGDTTGVFQVESPGMRDLLRRIGLTCIEELLALIALYRPGPMQFIDPYIEGKQDASRIRYDHPLLEPILKETYGIFVYQEQVQQAANVLAGFSLGQGDVLRRAMGKKKPEEMAKQRDKFIQGCHKTNKITAPLAGAIFDKIQQFAGYGFNKSHSAAYGIVTFQTAYLKAHYPAEFMAALLSSEMDNTEKLPVLIAECGRMGLPVGAPNVNLSGLRFKPVEDGIRFGMAGIKNVGVSAVEAMIREREANGPFGGLIDFCERIEHSAVNRKTMESLIKCGAFDFTDISRGRLFAGLETAMARGASRQRDRRLGQGSLFDMMSAEADSAVVADDEVLPPAEPWPESQMLSAEKELIGFYISGHPLAAFEWTLQAYGLHADEALDKAPHETPTRIGGLVGQFQKRFSKKNQKVFGSFRLETLERAISCVAFSEAFERYGIHLQDEAPVMVCGEVLKDDAGPRLRVQEVYPLADVPKLFTRSMGVHLPFSAADPDRLRRITDILRRFPGDRPVVLCLECPGGEKLFIRTHRDFHVQVGEGLVRALREVVGASGVFVEAHPKPYLRDHARGYRRFTRD